MITVFSGYCCRTNCLIWTLCQMNCRKLIRFILQRMWVAGIVYTVLTAWLLWRIILYASDQNITDSLINHFNVNILFAIKVKHWQLFQHMKLLLLVLLAQYCIALIVFTDTASPRSVKRFFPSHIWRYLG